nr:MAG TPA: hypothetical protein [Caudoviricetes sp.]
MKRYLILVFFNYTHEKIIEIHFFIKFKFSVACRL